MAQFCSNCGKPLEDGAAFCAECGTRVTPDPAAAQPAQPSAPQYTSQQGPSTPQYANQQSPAGAPQYPPQYGAPQYGGQYYGQPPYQSPKKKGKGALIAVICVLLAAAIGVLCYFGFRKGGFFRGKGGETTETSSDSGKETKPADTGKDTETETETETETSEINGDPIDLVAGVYEFTGEYTVYYDVDDVETDDFEGTFEFTREGDKLYAVAYIEDGYGDTIELDFDPDTMTATYDETYDSFTESGEFEFSIVGDTVYLSGYIETLDLEYDLPPDVYEFDGVKID